MSSDSFELVEPALPEGEKKRVRKAKKSHSQLKM